MSSQGFCKVKFLDIMKKQNLPELFEPFSKKKILDKYHEYCQIDDICQIVLSLKMVQTNS